MKWLFCFIPALVILSLSKDRRLYYTQETPISVILRLSEVQKGKKGLRESGQRTLQVDRLE